MMVVVAILVADMIKLLRSMIAPGDPESGLFSGVRPCVPPIEASFLRSLLLLTWQTECLNSVLSGDKTNKSMQAGRHGSTTTASGSIKITETSVRPNKRDMISVGDRHSLRPRTEQLETENKGADARIGAMIHAPRRPC